MLSTKIIPYAFCKHSAVFNKDNWDLLKTLELRKNLKKADDKANPVIRVQDSDPNQLRRKKY